MANLYFYTNLQLRGYKKWRGTTNTAWQGSEIFANGQLDLKVYRIKGRMWIRTQHTHTPLCLSGAERPSLFSHNGHKKSEILAEREREMQVHKNRVYTKGTSSRTLFHQRICIYIRAAIPEASQSPGANLFRNEGIKIQNIFHLQTLSKPNTGDKNESGFFH